jgi:hypothetical protein
MSKKKKKKISAKELKGMYEKDVSPNREYQ